MEVPIILGKRATQLSDVIECHSDCWNPIGYYIVGGCSAEIGSREEAVELARKWYPDLLDDLG